MRPHDQYLTVKRGAGSRGVARAAVRHRIRAGTTQTPVLRRS